VEEEGLGIEISSEREERKLVPKFRERSINTL